jgi:hypothetical protein
MNSSTKFVIALLGCLFCGISSIALAQQKPQWMPGQVGLNAGILPLPGFTYVNMDINYDAGVFNQVSRGELSPCLVNAVETSFLLAIQL